MKTKKKWFLGILLSLALVIGMMPALGLTQPAYAADPETWSENQTFDDDASFKNGVNVTGDITVTIAEGKTVTVDYGINAENKTLTVTGGGSLVVTGADGYSIGTIGTPGGDSVKGNITVSGSTVRLTGGNGGNGSLYGGDGGKGIDGVITVNDGSAVYVTGGDGGSGGGGNGSDGGSGGNGINGRIIVNGGTVEVSGGDGHTGGKGVCAPYEAQGDIVTVEGGSLNVTAGNGDTIGGEGVANDRNSSVSITNGSFTATGGNGESGGIGVTLGYVNVSGGAATLTGGIGNHNYAPATWDASIDCSNGIVAQESGDGRAWSDISGTSSDKRYVRAIQNYPLWVGGIQVTGKNAGNIDGNNTASYDAKTNTLTLKGATITSGYQFENDDLDMDVGIYYDGSECDFETLNVRLADGSENTVIKGGEGDFTDGIYTKNSGISFSGGGALIANGEYYGVDAGGNVTINGGNVTVNSSGEQSRGIFASQGITISGGKVTATASGVESCGIYAYNNDIVVGPGCAVKATGEDYAIYSGGSVTIDGVVEANGKDFGIFTSGEGKVVTIKKDGKLTASGGYEAVESLVINEIPGTGWINKEGTEGRSEIEVSAQRQDIREYKKVQFPAAPYNITVKPAKNGKVTVKVGGKEAKTAMEGDKLTLLTTPDKGCKLKIIKATYEAGGESTGTVIAELALKTVKEGSEYTCTMPAGNVTVSAAFETIGVNPEPKPAKASGVLMLKMKVKGKTGMKLIWNKIKGVKGYDVFFARCNHNDKKVVCKKIKSIKGNKTFKYTKSGLKKGTAYMAYVKAYVKKDGKKKYVKKSPLMHAYAGNGNKKFTNAKSVKVKKTKVTLKKGKTFKIKAKVRKVRKGKKLMTKMHAAKVRYLSTNKKVATVNKSGKIKAVAKGKCEVYAYAHNGVDKKIKVTVK